MPVERHGKFYKVKPPVCRVSPAKAHCFHERVKGEEGTITWAFYSVDTKAQLRWCCWCGTVNTLQEIKTEGSVWS